MRTILLLSTWLLMAPALLPAQSPGWFGDSWSRGATRYAEARVWVDDERDWFRRGERLRVRFATAADAYVAVIHIDPGGTLDFLYPASPWDDGYVQGGRTHTLPRGGSFTHLPVATRAGIGYLYIVASPEPLDYGYFGGGMGAGWDWSYAGRSVYGDPFWALEQITRILLPDWRSTPYATDVFSYHVEGRHHYPSYACGSYGSYGYDAGWGLGSYHSSCDRLSYFLRQHPGYYDTRLYRGDRRAYYREYEREAPRHGYKEPALRAPARAGATGRPPRHSGGLQQRARPQAEPQNSPAPRGRRAQPDAPARRPSLERRGGSGGGATARPSSPPRAEPKEGSSRGSGARGYVAPRPTAPAQPRGRPRPGGGEERPASSRDPGSAP